MNKTVTCNIAGLVFHIEEQAYEMLSKYLNALKMRLSKSEDAGEIIEDIETRIAELFSNSISNRQEVILEKNVAEVIAALGKPEDFLLDEEEPEKNFRAQTSAHFSHKHEKTLMRDTENGVIAGVCSGVAAYIGWDVVFVRILFLLAFFLTGFGFIVYIILWIAAPQAQTSADRLRMQGKPINVDTITEEVQLAAERVERYANSPKTKDKLGKIKAKGQEFGSMFRKFFGALLFIGGSLGIFFFLGFSLVENGFFMDYDGETPISLYHFSAIMFNSANQAVAGWFGLLSLVILPLLFVTIAGIFLIFSIRGKMLSRIFMTFLTIWIGGVITFGIVSAQIARDFSYSETQDQKLFSIDTDELTVEIPNPFSSGTSINISDDERFNLSVNESSISFNRVRIELFTSKDSLFYVESSKSASGISRRKAFDRASQIEHQVQLENNVLIIAPNIQFPKSDKLRSQRAVVRIAVPKNASIVWNDDQRNIYDIRDLRDKEWE